jgi:hypothetical protein
MQAANDHGGLGQFNTNPIIIPYPWAGPPMSHIPTPALTPTVTLQQAQSRPEVEIEYPPIGPWLDYLDAHPIRGKHQINFARYAPAFNGEGFFTMNQLVSDRVTVEKLSNWFGIGKGIADLLINYAQRDVESIKSGTLSMRLGAED